MRAVSFGKAWTEVDKDISLCIHTPLWKLDGILQLYIILKYRCLSTLRKGRGRNGDSEHTDIQTVPCLYWALTCMVYTGH